MTFTNEGKRFIPPICLGMLLCRPVFFFKYNFKKIVRFMEFYSDSSWTCGQNRTTNTQGIHTIFFFICNNPCRCLFLAHLLISLLEDMLIAPFVKCSKKPKVARPNHTQTILSWHDSVVLDAVDQQGPRSFF